ncbi:unnamed protein product [Phaedon cochleariae]|uniref:Protein DP71L n=1 Tax=Phaedon cochleariae TaxID=80249 RepID=A0A9P0DD74_PHACE|nr:unnamed protein product [Phaedon cochleariae]
MWNSSSSVSHPKPCWGFLPSTFQNQHRNFCLGISDFSTVREKCLRNQNSDKHDKQFQYHQPTARGFSPYKYNCHSDVNVDGSSINVSVLNTEYSSENSSHRNSPIMDVMVDKHCNMVHSLNPYPEDSNKWSSTRSSICDIEKCRKRNKKCLKRKAKNKHLKQSIQDIQEMMDITSDPDVSMSILNSNISLDSSETLNLADFIVNARISVEEESPVSETCNPKEQLLTITSYSPPKITYLRRDRQYSIAESEDSFIVFDGGSDEESEFDSSSHFSDKSKCDSTSDPEEYSSLFTIPSKKVRFAEEDKLCELHPMIHWSYAYQSARKGPWEQYARDRDRFNKRIIETENILSPILNLNHRKKVYKQRYEGKDKLMC